ncbi:MAG: DMT family transporter [Deltaproteobacteria bacterium]|nr:DMT family transporter [Deltaproteobacteria bacterium]
MRLAFITSLTLVAFAANSVLCRLALGGGFIDAASFTLVRLGSGALALGALAWLSARKQPAPPTGSWLSGLALFGYAAAFSFAYLTLDTGTGALILFGSVQLTMIGWGLRSGERLSAPQWMGVLLAFGGLVYLLLPGLTAPDPTGASLMAVSGAAWGVYSIRGRGAAAPLRMTSQNFVKAVPFAACVSVVAVSSMHLDPRGLGLALTSGVVTSGLGYALWYRALRGLTTTKAAVVQLTVPIIAAGGGVFFLGEPVGMRLVVASGGILGGVAVVVLGRGAEPSEP